MLGISFKYQDAQPGLTVWEARWVIRKAWWQLNVSYYKGSRQLILSNDGHLPLGICTFGWEGATNVQLRRRQHEQEVS